MTSHDPAFIAVEMSAISLFPNCVHTLASSRPNNSYRILFLVTATKLESKQIKWSANISPELKPVALYSIASYTALHVHTCTTKDISGIIVSAGFTCYIILLWTKPLQLIGMSWTRLSCIDIPLTPWQVQLRAKKNNFIWALIRGCYIMPA